MNGFERDNDRVRSDAEPPRIEATYSEISFGEIQRLLARARSERSACFAQLVRRTLASWSSVFRGPGYILPRDPGHRHLPLR